jgi:hypothetical protein
MICWTFASESPVKAAISGPDVSAPETQGNDLALTLTEHCQRLGEVRIQAEVEILVGCLNARLMFEWLLVSAARCR